MAEGPRPIALRYLASGGVIYIAYPVEALLCDAVHGVNASRLLVFDYFRELVHELVQRGDPPPHMNDVLEFVAGELGKVLDADAAGDAVASKKAAQRMFNLHGKKAREASAFLNDIAEPAGREGRRRFMADRLPDGGHGRDITRQHDRQVARVKRMWRVQELLLNRREASDEKRHTIDAELLEIYRNPAELD